MHCRYLCCRAWYDASGKKGRCGVAVESSYCLLPLKTSPTALMAPLTASRRLNMVWARASVQAASSEGEVFSIEARLTGSAPTRYVELRLMSARRVCASGVSTSQSVNAQSSWRPGVSQSEGGVRTFKPTKSTSALGAFTKYEQALFQGINLIANRFRSFE